EAIQKIKKEMQVGKYTDFTVDDDDVVRMQGKLCVPNDNDLQKEIMSEAHDSGYTVHSGGIKMYKDLKSHFWWNGMKKDVADYVMKCTVCQQVKIEHQRPGGLLKPLKIPEWKWDQITMDFVCGLPRTPAGYDAIWVIVDRLTKSAHFIPINMTYSMEKLARIYIREIVKLHRVPAGIVSDRDPRFVSKFWTSLQKCLGTKLHFSTAYHPQTDGQSERTIQTLEDMQRSCVMEFKGSWEVHLPLVEFAYNNSYHSTIKMPPYEALYGRRCRSPLFWDDVEKLTVGPDLVQDVVDKVRIIQARMKEAQDQQKSWADQKWRVLEFEVGDHVYLKVNP